LPTADTFAHNDRKIRSFARSNTAGNTLPLSGDERTIGKTFRDLRLKGEIQVRTTRSILVAALMKTAGVSRCGSFVVIDSRNVNVSSTFWCTASS
jgi:hypothetical protein